MGYQVKGVFYNKPVVTDKLGFYVDAANINSFNQDDLGFSGQSVNAQTAFVSVGTSSFVVPVGVTSISAVCVGGGGGGGGNSSNNADAGGGGGGGLSYGTFTVTPGETLTIVVGSAGACANAFSSGTSGGNSQVKRGSTVLLQGGGGAGGEKATQGSYGDGGDGGTSTGTERDGGGTGGDGGNGGGTAGSGGGAAGYSGNGGDGNGGANGSGDDGAGGGGGGGGGNYYNVGPQQGGGVGILGEGTSGTGGPANNGYNQVDGNPGSGGSGVTYGGGGGGAYRQYNNTQLVGGTGGIGAVRLVYQAPAIGNRIYPDGSGTLSNIADTTYSGPSNTWKDLSANGNDATLNFSDFDSNNAGSLVWGPIYSSGRRGDLSSDMFNPELDFTFSAWVRMPDTIVNNRWYVIVGNYSIGTSFELRYMVSSGGMRMSGDGWYRDFDNSDILVASTWYNITVTRSSDTYTLYYNGSSIDTESHPGVTFDFDGGPRSIGTQVSSENKYWEGNIATVMSYSKALTAAEVLQNYNALKDRYS